jgi:hypothetical protein
MVRGYKNNLGIMSSGGSGHADRREDWEGMCL